MNQLPNDLSKWPAADPDFQGVEGDHPGVPLARRSQMLQIAKATYPATWRVAYRSLQAGWLMAVVVLNAELLA